MTIRSLLVAFILAPGLLVAQETRPNKPRRSLADGLVRQWIETGGIRPLSAQSGDEMGKGQGPLALILRQKHGRLEVVPLRRGFGDHGPKAKPGVLEEEIEEVEEVEEKKQDEKRQPGRKGKKKPAAKPRAPRPARPIHIMLRRQGAKLTITLGRRQPPICVGTEPDRKALASLFARLHRKNEPTGAAHQMLISPNTEAKMQDFLTTWELARQAGFRTVGLGGGAGKRLGAADRETIATLPETLGWKKDGMKCDGELLILLDHRASWGETSDLLVQCAQAGIWQLAFVAQRDRKTRFKIPAHLPVDRGL